MHLTAPPRAQQSAGFTGETLFGGAPPLSPEPPAPSRSDEEIDETTISVGVSRKEGLYAKVKTKSRTVLLAVGGLALTALGVYFFGRRR
jgi:hypothetical protein